MNKNYHALKFLGFTAVFLFTSLFFGFNIVRYYKINHPATVSVLAAATDVIVIDPGHGGEDGGAVSTKGILEKDINLDTADALSSLFRFAGYNVILTRTTDTMLSDIYGDKTDGMKKSYDLKNRLRFAAESEATLLISIHCNKFPIAKYHGMQVFYSDNADSHSIADSITSVNKQYREPQTNREAKKATSAIYLLSHSQTPAVLVECGFLSNAWDEETLTTQAGRRDIASVIFTGVINRE